MKDYRANYEQPPVNQPDGMLYRRPWELTSETLRQIRIEQEPLEPSYTPPIPSQGADPLAGAYPDPVEYLVKRVPNQRSLNRAFNSAQGVEAPMPHTTEDIQYMVPPTYGWRQEELGILDIMDGVMTRLDDPTNPRNVGYLDDWSGRPTGGGYQGTEQNSHGEIPQGL
jgi:hypothetical protein